MYSTRTGGWSGRSRRPKNRKGRGDTQEVGVFVSNLPNAFEWTDLKDLCRDICYDLGVGEGKAKDMVRHANIARHPDGSSRGFGVRIYHAGEVGL